MIGDEVVAKLQDNPMFKMIECVKPGFINMTMSDEFIGDYVRVPVGENGRTAIVEVVDIDYFEEDEVPMPLEKVKVVIEKVDEFGVYPEDEE